MTKGDLYEFDVFRLDVRNSRLTRDGEPVQLPPKAFDVLVALVRHAGELVDKDALMREVWPDTFVEEANISRHVWTLRKALGDDEAIETVPKRGYRFTRDARSPAPPDLVIARQTETRVVTTEETHVTAARRWWSWPAAAVAIAALVWTVWALPRRTPETLAGDLSSTSPEARKWFALGETSRSQGRTRESVPFYAKAIERDPMFGLAESRLSDAYSALREPGERRAHALRAYELRAHANAQERLFIDASYYAATGDIPRHADALQLLIAARPDDASARVMLAGLYRLTGRFEAAVEEARAASRLDPTSAQTRATLGRALTDLNRFDEAIAVLDAAPDSASDAHHALRYELAFMRGDAEGMRRELDWAARTANDHLAAVWQARSSDFRGQRARARDLFARSLVLLKTRGGDQRIAEDAAISASRDAIVGDCSGVAVGVDQALAVRNSNTLSLTSLARALCGDLDGAAALAKELAQLANPGWLDRTVSLPIIDAFIRASRAPSPEAAVLARTIEPYELGQTLWPIYLRGLVHLKVGQLAEAAAAFDRILAQRGPAGLSIRYPLARLQLARTLARSGDRESSRKHYERFLEDWKDADVDLPVLIDARREYRALARPLKAPIVSGAAPWESSRRP